MSDTLALTDAFTLAIRALVPGDVPLKDRFTEDAVANELRVFPSLSYHRRKSAEEVVECSEIRRRLDALYECAESPIERHIAPWLLEILRGWPFKFRTPAVHLGGLEELPEGDVFIVPQMRFEHYRLDFGIVGLVDADGRVDGKKRIVAVECDGAEFHDILRDRERDGYLALHGIQTVRASGSEIIRDPESVAKRVWCAMVEMIGATS